MAEWLLQFPNDRVDLEFVRETFYRVSFGKITIVNFFPHHPVGQPCYCAKLLPTDSVVLAVGKYSRRCRDFSCILLPFWRRILLGRI